MPHVDLGGKREEGRGGERGGARSIKGICEIKEAERDGKYRKNQANLGKGMI